MRDNTRMQAMDAWAKCLEGDAKRDYAINDLLEQIAGEKRCIEIHDQDDDPIWTIIGSLTASERRKFIKGVKKILSNE